MNLRMTLSPFGKLILSLSLVLLMGTLCPSSSYSNAKEDIARQRTWTEVKSGSPEWQTTESTLTPSRSENIKMGEDPWFGGNAKPSDWESPNVQSIEMPIRTLREYRFNWSSFWFRVFDLVLLSTWWRV